MQYEAIRTGVDGGEMQLTAKTVIRRVSEKGIGQRWMRRQRNIGIRLINP